jgi:Zn-dependent protease with chaperone function
LLALALATTAADAAVADASAPELYAATEVREATELRLAQMLGPLRAAGRVDHDAEVVGRVRRIFTRVLAAALRGSALAAELEWAVYVYEEPLGRASATGSGKVLISTRFLERYSPDDDALAFVIGHEIAHQLCEHERLQLSLILARNGGNPLEARYAIEVMETEPLIVQALAPALRGHESVADRLGLELAAAAGFDPVRALAFFDAAARAERQTGFRARLHDPPLARKAALAGPAVRLRSATVQSPAWSCAP